MRATLRSVALASLVFSPLAAQPAEAAAACSRLQIISSMDIMVLPSGRPAVPVTIAGTPRVMLLDTGGAVSSITEKTAQELSLDRFYNGRGITGASGAFTNVLARVPTISIGRLQQARALYHVLPDEGPEEFDGILAGEFFKQYDADFDFGAGRLNLFLQDHCPGQVVYWQAPTVAVVPFQLNRSNHISFEVELDDKKVDAILDTGATNTVLNMYDARITFRVDVNAPDVEKIGDLSGANVYQRRFKTLAFEGVTINDPLIVLMPNLMKSPGSRGLPGLILGMSALRQMHVYVAYKERKLYITAANPQSTITPAAAQ